VAIAFDAATEASRSLTTDPYSFSHTPVGTPRAVVLYIGQVTSVTDHIVSVDYGGVPMTRIVRATDETTELGASDFWFLGSAVPTGVQTVHIDLDTTTTDDMYFVCETYTAGDDVEIVDFDSINGNFIDPQVTLQYGGRECLSVCGLFSGHANVGETNEIADMTRVHDLWPSTARGWITSRQTDPGSTDFTIGYSALNEDVAFVAMAMSEVDAAPVSAFGAAVATLSAFAAGTATMIFTFHASGAALATLSAFSSGSVTTNLIYEGSGTAVATLSAFASGTADNSSFIEASGAATRSLSPFASGTAHIVYLPGTEPSKRGGRSRTRFVYLKEEKQPEPAAPVAPPVPEATPLADSILTLPGFSPLEINPETWQRSITKTKRLRERAKKAEATAPVNTASVEDQLLEHFLQTIGGPVLKQGDDLPFMLQRFLRMGK
jgi:hypothetical protein